MEFILKGFKEELSVSALANVHYFELTENLHTTDDSHAFCELVYVEKGEIVIRSDNYSGRLSAGQFILHGNRERHSLSAKGDSPNIIIIGFECSSPAIALLTSEPMELSGELEKMLAEIIKEGQTVYLPPYNIPNVRDMKKRAEYDFGADQLIRNYLEIFLIKCIRLKTAGAANGKAPVITGEPHSLEIDEVKRYLDRNFCQKIKMNDLCFLFNTNKTTLSNDFKRATGITVIDYVNSLRIDYTKELIKKGGHTLTDIAEMMNLSSVHYLTTLFKKHTGKSPTEYSVSIKKS